MTLPSANPTLHCLDIGSLGRGEVIRLFPKDPNKSAELKEQGLSVTGQLPVLEYEGKILSQYLPILWFLARELVEYDGDTSFEKYRVDSVAEIYNDWRAQRVKSLGNSTDEFKHDFVPNYYKTIGQIYADQDGPYLLGPKVS
ncbi:uncharacterized protein LDX57_012695 [Aspergillus melleus]|uniref:uncharacterized protein n=1 Tax=Aspergillus melleus TaxID=138277 RepID=UPI001E8EA597|nr:uncharacterized protein LDX57_012695 [Aspergillus melleus]KAH8435066.1 hypothetical protein LDX57_012695 [Aspergillus melleus]